jgi:hypothetical protein
MAVPARELIDAIYRDKLRRAEESTPGERLLDGPRLFDMATEWTKAGIRADNPDASEEEVHRIFLERLELVHRLENRA